ncbi:MAG TPA: hypothetical protein VE963_01895 [Reyranella sp.]|nr:hypothetical protein [Reyranella sp.]
MCRAHGRAGTFLPHMWVNAEPVPRFYPNAVTLTHDEAAVSEQRDTIGILVNSNLPGRWAIKDSFNTLELARSGFDVLQEASWIRNVMPTGSPSSDITWQRESQGKTLLPYDDPDFAMFTGRRGFAIVAGGMLYRAGGIVGVSNVVADSADAVSVWRSLSLLAARLFPRLPLVGYESGRELQAALDAGFEIGDALRIWVRAPD